MMGRFFILAQGLGLTRHTGLQTRWYGHSPAEERAFLRALERKLQDTPTAVPAE
ncbi:hypothetical protein CKO38_10090 [Rhodospirillum rubrum]|uniref:hypothetical protein n=1 Tax=Rhodospirillum rubrum TaxID=1085 RepID=UPI00190587F5|nr:hypothetical protein [Rhodospirillum rubrum]MBK1665074.1 hypothetical protein [Rhodospirillum rubrum]MBK1677010.1 hypothetical protein [Rhodospirillum rubrum]